MDSKLSFSAAIMIGQLTLPLVACKNVIVFTVFKNLFYCRILRHPGGIWNSSLSVYPGLRSRGLDLTLGYYILPLQGCFKV